MKPLVIKNPSMASAPFKGLYIEVPCGKCIACRIAKSKEWSTRLLYESEKYVNKCSFITLTYDDEHLPSDCGLQKIDLQRFWKRLRKRLYSSGADYHIRYFACGEYGDTYCRPHYHAIVFGLPPSMSDIVKSCWTFGFVKVGTVSVESINYVTGYVMKKYGGDLAKDTYGDRQPPFQCSSQKLGLEMFEKVEAQRAEERGYMTIRGVKRSIPRYYIKKLGLDVGDKLEKRYISNGHEEQREMNAREKFSQKKRGNL